MWGNIKYNNVHEIWKYNFDFHANWFLVNYKNVNIKATRKESACIYLWVWGKTATRLAHQELDPPQLKKEHHIGWTKWIFQWCHLLHFNIFFKNLILLYCIHWHNFFFYNVQFFGLYIWIKNKVYQTMLIILPNSKKADSRCTFHCQ